MTSANEVSLLASMLALLLGGGALLLLTLGWRRAAAPPYAKPGLLFRQQEEESGAPQAPHRLADPGASAKLRPSGTSRRYCLITPCRDEARYARRTLDAITRQTEAPALWVIVDDGSKDSTPEILAEYAARFPYIRIVRRADRGDRKLGGGVIDAFYAGYDTIDPAAYEYVCKLDLDLDIPRRYFELLMDWMEAHPRIGTCSGKPYFTPEGQVELPVRFPLAATAGLVSEKCGDENSVGMIKFYRTDCFCHIGGFVRELMWDGIDGHRCRQLGWIALSSDHPELRFVHLRPMGTSHKNWWTGRVRHGYGQYFMGTTPIYMLASALYRMTRPPRVLGGVAMLYGYFRAMAKRTTRYGDADYRHFVRRYQWACLVKGKAAATTELDATVAPRWRPGAVATAQRPRLGEVLVQTCALALDKLEEALAAQRGEYAGARLGEILVRMKTLSEDQVLRALAIQVGQRGSSLRPDRFLNQASGAGM